MTTHAEEIDLIDDVEDAASDETIPFEYSISWYGADFTVDGLVNRLNRGDIFTPEFQRAFVWNRRRSSRFVESLLLGLPVPGIFLSIEEGTNKLIVVDGQQRLKSLRSFYANEFALANIESRFAGKTYDTLEPEDRRRLDDSILHATVVRQDKPSDDNSSIYLIFERINTGGERLRPQEIRAAIYPGEFNDLIRNLNNNIYWREMFGKVDLRMRDQELILRFLAMYFNRKEYKSPLTRFLNEYMGSNRHLKVQSEEEIRHVFENTMETIHAHLGANAFKPPQSNGRFTAAVFDSVAVGVANRLEWGNIQNGEVFKAQYNALIKDEDYLKATFGGTAQTSVVEQRLSMAIEAFSDIP